MSMAAAGAVAAGFTSCTGGGGSAPATLKAEADRNEAPDFSLVDAGGQTVKLSELKGKVVLLNFWATWCAPCRIEIPWFVDMEREFKDQGFAVVGVSMDEDGWEVVKPFISDMKVNYRMVLGTEELAQLYSGVQALPTSFVIDRNGRIASTHMGIVSRSVFEEEIRALLQNKGTSGGA
ncbi:MAG: TlpA family protein disulfide reductase [Bryobacterales bacterium]|nr:TlpA family protein disulfide reductase [Bryobacterales bacterium]